MVVVVVVVVKLNAHTENATVLLHAVPEAHSFSHQSSSADEADQGKGGGVTLGSVPECFHRVTEFTLAVQQLRGGSGISLRGSRRSSWPLR